MTTILITLLGALMNRLRGGLLQSLTGINLDWIGRFGQPILMGVMIWFLVGSLTASILGCVGMFLGQTFAWGNYIGAIYGHGIQKDRVDIEWIEKVFPKDYENPVAWGVKCLSLRGLVWTACMAVPVIFFVPIAGLILPIGLLMGLVYYVSSLVNQNGEYYWGAVLWGATYLILS